MSMSKSHGLGCLLQLVFLYTYGMTAAKMEDEKRLFLNLTAGTFPQIRPVYNHSMSLPVALQMKLIGLDEVSAEQGTISTHIYMSMIWNDITLKWNPADFGDISQIRMPVKNIWTPDIIPYNGHMGVYEVMDTQAKVDSGGKITWITLVHLATFCAMNFTRFPFDEQTCEIKMGSWTYNGFLVQLELDNTSYSHNDVTNVTGFGEWILSREPVTKINTMLYACCKEPYLDMVLQFSIKRSHTYIVHLFLAPAVMIALLLPAIFAIPPGSTGKIVLGTSVIISLVLLLVMLEKFIPANHFTVPLIAQYYLACIIMAALSTAASCIVTNIWNKGTINVVMPPVITSALTTVSWLFLLDIDRFMPSEATRNDSTDQTHTQAIQAVATTDPEKLHNKLVKVAEWRLLSALIDRFLILLSLVFISLTTIVMLSV